DIYSALPEREEVGSLAAFLVELQKRQCGVEVFTTNYDLVLDTIVSSSSFDTGLSLCHLSSGVKGTILDMGAWALISGAHLQSLEGERGRLTKLHGSVNWKRNGEDIIVGDPSFAGDHAKHPVLYPGFKGEPEDEPFISFHQHLEWAVSKAQAAIFIGFSFRDPYINGILSNLSSEILKTVVNKNEIQEDQFPFDGPIFQTSDGFQADAVSDIVDLLDGRA
ncbi:MAG: SIR2 family protein, partial [Candidatus Poribacteria bacterium]|nr:SIR2 family protein [Candidatus Poribacteria bacterium]